MPSKPPSLEARAKGGRNSAGGGRLTDSAKALARKHGKNAFPTLGKIADDKKADPRDRINAIKVLLGYGYGQPKQEIDADVKLKWLIE